MKAISLHRLALLFPALTWLFIQFAMAGVFVGSSAGAMQIEICSTFGVQTITVDAETGEPVEPVASDDGCDWCQSFGLVIDTAKRGDESWHALAHDYRHKLVLAPAPHKPLRLTADYKSRAPPIL